MLCLFAPPLHFVIFWSPKLTNFHQIFVWSVKLTSFHQIFVWSVKLTSFHQIFQMFFTCLIIKNIWSLLLRATFKWSSKSHSVHCSFVWNIWNTRILDNSKLGSTQQWMTLTYCQDHILKENIRCVWSKTSNSGNDYYAGWMPKGR